MRKLLKIVMVFFIATAVSLCSCVSCLSCAVFLSTSNKISRTVEVRGLDNFEQGLSSNRTTYTLIPERVFIDNDDYDYAPIFPYDNGDFFYFFSENYNEEKKRTEVFDKTLLYLQYDKEFYQIAKECLMERALRLSEEPVEVYNDYIFYDNNSPTNFSLRGSPPLNNDYAPYEFVRFAYNDSNRTIVCIGFYTRNVEEVAEVADDWGAFLERYFGEWYSFE